MNITKLSFNHFALGALILLFAMSCTVENEAPANTDDEVEVVEVVEVDEEPADEPVEEVTESTEEEVAESDDEITCADAEMLCVGLVTNVGTIDDKSFNQSAWEGVTRAQEDLIAQIDYIETVDPADFDKNLAYFGDKDFDVIVTVGFPLFDPTVSASEKYPNTRFIGVDQFQAEEINNLTGLIFPEFGLGFLAGVLAGMATEDGIVGGVFGTDIIPSLVLIKEGFDAGVYAVDPDIEVLSVYHPGGLEIAFVDPEWGAETASEMMDSGADVIFAAAGFTGNGVLEAVASNSEDSVYCIGVDTDQYFTVPEGQGCLISSAMKQVGEGVFQVIGEDFLGQAAGGNFMGKVELAPFHEFEDLVSAEARVFLSDIQKMLIDGEIPTDGTFRFPNAPSLFATQ
ncbi:MAG: BMP family ABC transporter substrate-binding protein [Chloroflexota bacterium]